MRKAYPRKFIFTQISAPFVGFAGVFLTIFILNRLHWIPDPKTEPNLIKILIIVILFITVLIGSMVLWGRILVMLGILTEEEAKGYPYSKPWEKDTF